MFVYKAFPVSCSPLLLKPRLHNNKNNEQLHISGNDAVSKEPPDSLWEPHSNTHTDQTTEQHIQALFVTHPNLTPPPRAPPAPIKGEMIRALKL